MNASPLVSQFRISAAMRPYVLRVRPRGTDFEFGSEPEQVVAYTKCIMDMRRILVGKRGVPAIAADRAILKSLEAAFEFQLADLRYGFLKTIEGHRDTSLRPVFGLPCQTANLWRIKILAQCVGADMTSLLGPPC